MIAPNQLDWPEHQLQHDVFTEETNQSPEQSQRHRPQLMHTHRRLKVKVALTSIIWQWTVVQRVTWKGVLTLLTSVSRMCTLSCVCSRMKDRKVWRRAGSGMERRKRSRYAVVVITSSRVSCTEGGGRGELLEQTKTSWQRRICWPCLRYTAMILCGYLYVKLSVQDTVYSLLY